MKHSATVAETLAQRLVEIDVDELGDGVRERAEEMVLDISGLCLAAHREDYVQALLASWDDEGPCTVLGHEARVSAAAAAMINGTAAHGEDYDDTFEGGPVHSGVVMVPSILAACERYALDGRAALLGLAVGAELMCRLSMVVPKAVHKSGFHPTSVFGVMGAAAGIGVALGLDRNQLVNALGVAGSMASGIIEYLSSGAWTKRMHPGWAAQAGLRAAVMARHGFVGPPLVFEGEHGLFNGFAHTTRGDFSLLAGDLGKRWLMETIAFKPYACGTMTHPYIDCAMRLRNQGVTAERIADIECETAEGILHRLWEPLPLKRSPPNAYAAKFSIPFCVASAFVTGSAGLEAFTPERVADPRLLQLAAKVRYRIDPQNPYPNNYTGHMRVTTLDGKIFEARQPHLRGGAHERLTRAELERKFTQNAALAGWSDERSARFQGFIRSLFDGPVDLSGLRS